MQSYMLKVLRVGEPVHSMKVDSPEIARRYWDRVIKKQTWFDENKEHLIVLLLSTQSNVEGYSLASIGTLTESLAHPREIFRAAIAIGCYAIVVMHNHPSGDPSPSETDRSLTQRLIEAAELLQIKLFDHVIVGHSTMSRRARSSSCQLKAIRSRRKSRYEHCASQGYFSFKEAGAI